MKLCAQGTCLKSLCKAFHMMERCCRGGGGYTRVQVIGVRVYSSTDLANWENEGIALFPPLTPCQALACLVSLVHVCHTSAVACLCF